jgi:acyl-coenzyme A synthetase/AMP-(fatty) acid ligase
LYQALADKFKVPIIEAFGMTESLSHCFTNPLHREQRMDTVGLPSGVEARIIQGQLYIRGPSVFTREWFATGDLAEQDCAGYYRILGRQQDRIVIKGYKLDPLSIENQLRQMLPELEELVVFGEDRVKCVYVGPYDIAQVNQCLKSLGSHCFPSVLQQVDTVPKNNSGKISRKQLNGIF